MIVNILGLLVISCSLMPLMVTEFQMFVTVQDSLKPFSFRGLIGSITTQVLREPPMNSIPIFINGVSALLFWLFLAALWRDVESFSFF